MSFRKDDLLFALALVLASCGQPGAGTDATDAAAASPAPSIARETRPVSGGEGTNGTNGMLDDRDDEPLAEKFGDGARVFAKAKETLLQNYYAEGVTEDDLYRAATAGMLEKLDPKMSKWNKLLTKGELAEMRNDLKGELVGIGVHIKFDAASGYADVLAAIAGSPAEKAGLVAGDKIVTVNGKLYKGMRLKDVVADIRGKAGEKVTLSILRGDKLVSIAIVREKVAYDQPSSLALPDGLGYLRIPSFNEKTPGAVRASLEDLTKQNVAALVVDLRQNPGGSFDSAVETADLLLPKGAPVVTLKRKGKPEERHVAKGTGLLLEVPVAVLVDHGTASGAEFVTAALSEDRHARVVGASTTGKWSVQMIDDLSNGFAMKYTVSLFHAPSGKSYEGVGLAPDVEVAMDEGAYARARATEVPAERLGLDVQLRTAKEILVRK